MTGVSTIELGVDIAGPSDRKAFETDAALILKRIEKLKAWGLTVATADFESMVLFKHQRAEAGFRTLDELKATFGSEEKALRAYFRYDGAGLFARNRGQNENDSPTTEKVGVSTGLLVANELFDLTEADWQRIDVTATKDLDFDLASDGEKYIAVETRARIPGTHSDDNFDKILSNAASEARVKKRTQRSLRPTENTMLGFVTMLSPEERATVYVVDPDGPDVSMEPRSYRVLARLVYYWRLLRFSRAQIVVALANRIRALQRLSDITALDKLALTNASGKALRDPISFGAQKTQLLGGGAVADIFRSDKTLYLIGIDRTVLRILSRQNFSRLSEFRSKLASGPIEESIHARIRRRDLGSPGKQLAVGPDGRVSVPSFARIQVNSAGRVFGTVKIDQEALEKQIAKARRSAES